MTMRELFGIIEGHQYLRQHGCSYVKVMVIDDMLIHVVIARA
ncbi:MAG: hypothetical protein ACI4C1_01380 [Lachnospiraceae bacterium]